MSELYFHVSFYKVPHYLVNTNQLHNKLILNHNNWHEIGTSRSKGSYLHGE
jgi:hypothetical protein